jgi:DNA-binding transcriptional ArsR family regulator
MLKALFGNATIVTILEYLREYKAASASQMARDCDIPLNMVQNQLKRLEAGQIVQPHYCGRQKIYRWNRDQPGHAALLQLLRKASAANDPFDNAPDSADGRHLSIPGRLRLAEQLRREAEYLTPVARPDPFTASFESFEAYESWKKKQTNPWLL